EYWAADAGGPRAEQAGKVEARLLLSRSEGGTVARAGGNTCAPLSAHVGSLVGNRTLSRAPNDRLVTHMRHQRRWSKPHLYWTGMNGSGNTGRTRACHRRAYSNLDAWAARAPSRPEKRHIIVLRCEDVPLEGLLADNVYQNLVGIQDTAE